MKYWNSLSEPKIEENDYGTFELDLKLEKKYTMVALKSHQIWKVQTAFLAQI